LALRLSPCQTGPDALYDAILFELGNGPQNGQLQPSGWGGGVYALSQRYERHAECLKVIQ
jgi:hypothetical protein